MVFTNERSVLTTLCERLSAFEPYRIADDPESVRRASVAAILRWRPSRPVSLNHVEKCTDVATFLNQSWVKDDEQGVVEILFIRRATRKGDRWSGHIAFPGGKRESSERDEDTAVREVQEEVGLDLQSEDFILLGQLDERNALGGTPLPPMALNPFVFLQLVPETPAMQLQASEVAAAQWVPFSFFLSTTPYPRQNSNARVLSLYRHATLRHMTQHLLGTMTLPAVELPTDSIHGPPFKLWGLTMGMTCDLVDLVLQSPTPSTNSLHPQGQFLALTRGAPLFSCMDIGCLATVITKTTLKWRSIRGDFNQWSRWRYQRETEAVYYASIHKAILAALWFRAGVLMTSLYLAKRMLLSR